MYALTNCDIYTGKLVEYDKAILIDDDRIQNLVPTNQIPKGYEIEDLGGLTVSPGFIDIQVNGGGGILFNDSPTIEGIEAIVKSHRKFGTTNLLPTYITGPLEGMERASLAVKKYMEGNLLGILGIHFEGPFILEAKAGVHDKNFIRTVSDEYINIYKNPRGGITLVTLAPDVVSIDTIENLVRSNILVSLGHSNADYDTAFNAIEAGASSVTHLFNAMSAFQSRSPGMVGAALNHKESWVGIIADGFHVDVRSLEIAVRAKKGERKMILVTDAMPPVGEENPTGFRLGEYKIIVKDGKCETEDGVLAGSALDMATAIRNCIQRSNLPKDEALRMASTYPAEFLGIDDMYGYIQAGYKANLAIMNNQIHIKGTIIEGKKFF